MSIIIRLKVEDISPDQS